ncbi:hypothetical protein KA977_08830 [Candidatus Dependentiae bacterium]|nr:hypothetical protein [Candidatus Dependentiae bacterium]
MNIKANFICQDKLSYVPVNVRQISNTKLIKYSYKDSKKNKHFLIFIAILSLIISFLITYFNIGKQLQNYKVLPNSYHKNDNESELDLLKKYKNILNKID